MFSIDTVRFQGDVSDFFFTGRLTSLRLKTIMAPIIHAPSIAPVSNSDYNKTDGH